MPGTFRQRMPILRDLIGAAPLVAEIDVDQVYAGYQHFRTDLKHPRGGGPYFLTAPFAKGDVQLAAAARSMLTTGLAAGLQAGTEQVADAAEPLTPVDTELLRGSRSIRITRGGSIVYQRPAKYQRLSKDELKAWKKAHAEGGPARRQVRSRYRTRGGRIPR